MQKNIQTNDEAAILQNQYPSTPHITTDNHSGVHPFPIGLIRFNYVSPHNSPRILPKIQFDEAQKSINPSVQQKRKIKFIKIITVQQVNSATSQNHTILDGEQAKPKQTQIKQQDLYNKTTVKKLNLPPIFEHPNDQDEDLTALEKASNKVIDLQQNIQNSHRRLKSNQSADRQSQNQSLAIQDDKVSLKYKLQQIMGKNQDQKNSLKGSQDLQNLQQKIFKKHKINKSSSIPVTSQESIYRKLYDLQEPESLKPAESSIKQKIENKIQVSSLMPATKNDTQQCIQKAHQFGEQTKKQEKQNNQFQLHENQKIQNQIPNKKCQQVIKHKFLTNTYKIKVKKKDLSDLYGEQMKKSEQ